MSFKSPKELDKPISPFIGTDKDFVRLSVCHGEAIYLSSIYVRVIPNTKREKELKAEAARSTAMNPLDSIICTHNHTSFCVYYSIGTKKPDFNDQYKLWLYWKTRMIL